MSEFNVRARAEGKEFGIGINTQIGRARGRATAFHVETHADPRRRAPGCADGDGERRRRGDQDASDSDRRGDHSNHRSLGKLARQPNKSHWPKYRKNTFVYFQYTVSSHHQSRCVRLRCSKTTGKELYESRLLPRPFGRAQIYATQ